MLQKGYREAMPYSAALKETEMRLVPKGSAIETKRRSVPKSVARTKRKVCQCQNAATQRGEGQSVLVGVALNRNRA